MCRCSTHHLASSDTTRRQLCGSKPASSEGVYVDREARISHYTLGKSRRQGYPYHPNCGLPFSVKAGDSDLEVGRANVLLKGVITKVEYLRGERRWKYKIPWDSHTSRSKTIARLLRIEKRVDEGLLDIWTVKKGDGSGN